MADINKKITWKLILTDEGVKAKLDATTGALRNANGQFAKTTINVKDLNKANKELLGSLSMTENEINAQAQSLRNLQKNAQIGSREYADLGQGVADLGQAMGGASMATGGMTSSALELGRVISDAPYGIRGMANNLSQLGSNLFFAAKQAGGMKNAITGLLGALRGPLGILVAFQAVIAAIDYFSASSKEAEDSTKSFTEELQEQVDTLKIYDSILKESNLSIEQRNGALKAAAESDKELSKILMENIGNMEKQTEALSEFISMKEDEIKLKLKINEVEEIASQLKDAEITSLDDITNKRKAVNDLMKFALKAGQSDATILSYLKQLSALNDLEDAFHRQRDLLGEINGLLSPDRDGEGPSLLRGTIAWYNAQIKGLKKIQEESVLTNQAYQPLQEQIERYLEKINEIRFPKKEAQEGLSGLTPSGITSVGESPEVVFEMAKNETLVNLRKGLALEMQKIRTSEELAEFYTEHYKRKVAEATLKHAQGIFRNLQGLAGKNKKLRAAFIIAEKAASIAQMFQSYNTATLANTAHAATLGPVAGPAYLTGANTLAKVNLIGGIASTVAQTAKALSALNASGGGGGASAPSSAGGGGGRTFDFNLVGSTGQDQLAQAVGGQLNQGPIQSYVVSSQITSQQQLDNIIESDATFGGDN
jgi:hypothetical protein